MSTDIAVTPIKQLGLSTVGIDGSPLHILHVRAANDQVVNFGLTNDELSAFIIRAQDCLAKGLGYEVNGAQ